MRYKIIFRLLQAFGTAAVILMGVSYASSDSSSSSSNIMRRTGVIVLAILYVVVVGICIFLWTQIRFVMKYRKQVSFPRHCQLSDHCSYALSSALEGHLCRPSIPGHSNGLQRPDNVLHKLACNDHNRNYSRNHTTQYWRPGKIQHLHGRMADLPCDVHVHGVCDCDHLFRCILRAAPQRRSQKRIDRNAFER
jgi:hypothetical protein